MVGTGAALLRDFVNTHEPQTGDEALTDPAALAAWWVAHDLAPRDVIVGPADLTAAITVREGLRSLLQRHTGDEPDPVAVDALDRVLAATPLRLELRDDSCRLVGDRADPPGAALAALLNAVHRCHEDGSWARLKVCARDSCRWAFYDASRNQVRRWCSMAGCGNTVKMRRARAVRRERDRPAT